MTDELRLLSHPELVIGLAGPIGIDIEAMAAEVDRALGQVNYVSRTVRITELMLRYNAPGVEAAGSDYFSNMNFKMDHANKLCELAGTPDALMWLAIEGIRERRRELVAEFGVDSEIPSDAGYIIRQLKRPEEVQFLRRIYGKNFVLISGYGSQEHRLQRVSEKGRASLPIATEDPTIAERSLALLLRDQNEGREKYVQHLRDTFHLADVFVDGINRDQMRQGLERFFQAFFGRVDIGPTKAEYGMYAAKAASLRSTDLSRQVGSAIFSDDGEIISQGCNEVPRAFGGTYWHGEEPDFRDVRIGYDANDILKKDVIRDLLEKLDGAELLVKRTSGDNFSDEFVDQLLGRSGKEEPHFACLKDSQISSLTEYGRVVHAEMVSICDAARLGKAVKGTTLYVTTFPCHNCTKHIIGSGIKRVIFLEPYPKSRAKQLHSNEIEIEKSSSAKVSFLPFLGISPFRYRDIFEKGSRKLSGQAKTWYAFDDRPRPLVPESLPNYIGLEDIELDKSSGEFEAAQS
jgi:deoxycytidylate deaminase|tara:strand:+ start:226 stop:1776 length:1551 start_codon:yes stop_codon:yes gene_type:complete